MSALRPACTQHRDRAPCALPLSRPRLIVALHPAARRLALARGGPWSGLELFHPRPIGHRPRGGRTGSSGHVLGSCSALCAQSSCRQHAAESADGGAGQHPQQLWRQIDTSSALAGPPTGRTPRTKSGAFRPSCGRGLRSCL